MGNKTLQVAIAGVLVAISVGLIWKLPDNFNSINLILFKLGFVSFILLIIIALIVLGLSQTQNKPEYETKLVKIYEKIYRGSFIGLVGFTLLDICFNIALYISPIIKNLEQNSLTFILTISIFVLIVNYLNKRGIKLFGEEDE